ncbi:MAG TPA: hypothetical protein VK190_02510 [Pseudoneobacillus sp.]|nr:hypothetical protein [Pseudoneobacillus sp.]
MFKLLNYIEYCYLLDKYLTTCVGEDEAPSMFMNTIIDTFPPEMTYRWGKWKAFMEPYRDSLMGLSVVLENTTLDKPMLKIDGVLTHRIRIYRPKDGSGLIMTGKDMKFGYEVQESFNTEMLGLLIKEMMPGSPVIRKKTTPETDLKYVQDNFPQEMQDKICGFIMTYRLQQAVQNVKKEE